jgi:autotransporter-associated beta strand protein
VNIAAGGTLDVINGATVADAINNAGGNVANSAGLGTVSGLMTLTANGSSASSGGSGLTFSGGIGEAGGSRDLTVTAGAGQVTMAGAGTYTGTTSINSGAVLQIGNGGAAGTVGSGGVINSGTLRINKNIAVAVSNLTGSGALDQAGSGTTTIGGALGVFTGNVIISGGTLAVDNASIAASGSNSVFIAAGKTLDILNGGTVAAPVTNAGGIVTNSAGNGTLSGAMTLTANSKVDSSVTGTGTGLTISGAIGGGFGLTKDVGPGTVTLSSASGNAYTGATTISAGTLAVSGAGTTGTAAGGVSIAAGATLDIISGASVADAVSNMGGTVDNSVGSGTLAGVMTLAADSMVGSSASAAGLTVNLPVGDGGNARSLTKVGGGTVTLLSANTYTGATHVSAGKLITTAAEQIDNLSAVTVDSGATLDLGGTETIASLAGGGNVLLGNNTLTTGDASNTTYGGQISGSGGLTKQGSGTMTLSGTNAYTGVTRINGGVLATTADERIADTSALIIGGSGNLSIGGNETAASIDGAGTVALANHVLTVGDGSNTTYGGIISGSGGSLVKTGGGILTLTGHNLYTADTTVNGGTLKFDGAAASAGASSGTIIVAAPTATLELDNGAILANPIRIAGATIRNSAGTAVLSGPVTLEGDTTFDTTGAGLTTTGSIAEIGGSRMLIKSGAAELALVGVNTYTGLTRIDSGSIRTTQAERIADASPVVIAAGAALVLGGNEAVASVAGAGAINLGASTLTVGGTNATTTFSGVISDGGSGGRVAKSGSGNWSLTGANSYGGGTAIDGGTLTLSGATASAGTGAITIAAGTTLDLIGGAVVNSAVSNQGGTLANSLGGATLSGAMTLAADSMIQVDGSGLTIGAPIGESGGSFGLTKLGAGNLTLSASTSSSYSGATIVSAGSLITGVANQIGDASAVTVMNGASLSLGGNETLGSLAGGGTVNLSTHKLTTGVNGATTTFAGVIGGSGAFAKSGVGTLTLSGANTYTGATTVNQGTLATAGGDNIADASAVTVASGATLSLDGNPAHQDTVASLDLAGTLNGAGTLSAATYVLHDGAVANANLGAGSLTSSAGESLLNGTSAATSVNVSAGRLSLGSANRLADTSALTVAAPGSLRLNGDDSVGSLNLAGILEGTGTLTAATYGLAGGKVNANLGSGALSSSGASTLSGTAAVTSVAVNSGDLSLTSANRLSDKANVTVATAASLSAASDQVIGRLAGDGQVKLSSNATLTTGAAGDSTFGGALVGAGALHKSGTSTFILTGDNTNTGITTIDAAGVLQVGSGGTTGNLGGNTIVDNGTLRFDHAGNYTVANAISGTGSLEQAGSGQFTATGVLSYTGISRVSAGAWLTGGANQLPDASDVVVGASGKLILAGDETVASITADGPVTLGGSVTTTADQIYRGSVTAPATAITLTAHDISAVNDGNLWGIQPLNLVANSAVVSAGKSDATTWRDLKLGHVTLTQGGVVDAGQIVLGDAVTLNGGVFELNAHQAASYAKLYLDPIDKAIRTVATLEQLALADDVVTQDAGSKIVVGNGATLLVSALGGGSVNLGNVANDLHGGVSVLSGPAFNTAWQTNRIDLVGGLKPAQLTSGQSQIQIAGSQILVAGKGIEGDLVAMKAEKLSTAVDATIVARLPYDDSRGTSVQHPALTFELLPAAFLASGTFGADGSEIKVAVGARETGSRTISFSAGFVQSLPLGGAKGATAIYLKGPAASSGSGGYRFFHDGAAVITEIPVSYNGVRPQSPQVTGSLSAVVAVSEGARKERFEESLRTENVALRLRLGVVAEVGPGPSATRGGGEAAPPEACASAANVFECSGGDNATRPQSQTPQSGSTQDNGSAGSRPATTAAGNGDKKAEACAQTADGKPCEDGK